MRSEFQKYHSLKLIELFDHCCDLHFVEELKCKRNRFIDLGTPDLKYGIEIKNSLSDLTSGSGLNVNDVEYGYVLIRKKYAERAIGHLYSRRMANCGLIAINEDDTYFMFKQAKPNFIEGVTNVLDYFISSSDSIQVLFEQYRAVRR